MRLLPTDTVLVMLGGHARRASTTEFLRTSPLKPVLTPCRDSALQQYIAKEKYRERVLAELGT